jgi:hypothetical protein
LGKVSGSLCAIANQITRHGFGFVVVDFQDTFWLGLDAGTQSLTIFHPNDNAHEQPLSGEFNGGSNQVRD